MIPPTAAVVRVDGIDRPYPRLWPCIVCGRPPELSTGYVGRDGQPRDADGPGPYLVVCRHGAPVDAPSVPTTLDTSVPGLLRFVSEGGPSLYRSWEFDRAVTGWNVLHPRMRALTILQPSATAIAIGGKGFENRGNPPPSTVAVGEWIALHAGVAVWKHADLIRRIWPECPPDEALPFAAVIGAWRYDGTVPPDGTPWALGPCCLRVGAVVVLPEPLPCREGHHQGWWFLPGDIAAPLRAAIRASGLP